jgi:hypothetical protein
MTKPIARKLRCAIYTRKSSEEGLEQEFNSLHAQREACEAYVASQRSEGWTLIREYQGIDHCVTVRDGDYEYQGRPYKSLSAIARAITGTRWNGLLFFGLKNRKGQS